MGILTQVAQVATRVASIRCAHPTSTWNWRYVLVGKGFVVRIRRRRRCDLKEIFVYKIRYVFSLRQLAEERHYANRNDR